MQLATTIDEVIEILETIISSEVNDKSTLAFFPVLYKKVTERIKLGIATNEFENNERMEQLDVIFANRYLEAYYQWKNGAQPSESWLKTFQAGSNSKLIVIQHLLLGMNAHINLDLGIAVVQTVPEDGDLVDLLNDFNKINEILASMVDDVQGRIGTISPLFYLLEKVGKGREDKLVNFSINLARDGAWLFANEYWISFNKTDTINQRDAVIAVLANKLTTSKSWLLRQTIRLIRFMETKNVLKIVRALDE